MKDLYIISFGSSDSYRYYTNDIKTVDSIRDEIKRFLLRKFPSGNGLEFLEKADIKRVPLNEEALYAGYKILDGNTIDELKHHLERERDVARDVEISNNGSPYANEDKSAK